jgi:hypothetical protein
MDRGAFINSQVACMTARLTAMQEQNTADREAGRPVTYSPEDFEGMPDQYGLGHNAVVEYLRGADRCA